MKFPNKITTYKESVISKLPMLLNLLNSKDYSVINLYNEVRDKVSIKDFQDALVILYALGKIKLVGEVIYYVERNIL